MLSSKKHIIGIALLFSLLGCTTSPENDSETVSETVIEDRPLVVATTDVLCNLTEQIAEDTIDLKCLVDAGVDPHVYQPTPEDRQAIDQAQLILYAGYGFDPALIRLIQASSNPAPRVPVHEKAVVAPLMGGHSHDHEDEHSHDHHHHDHSHDHHHHEDKEASDIPDSHVWHDPQNGIKMVEVISAELQQLQPEQASLYQANAQSINAELADIDEWIKTQVATIPPQNRKLVTTHDALGYYIHAYGFEFAGALSGLSTEESPTAARVGELVKDIQKTQVPTIFAEKSVNPQLIETVGREANVSIADRVLYADGLGLPESEADTYQKMLIANTQTIVEGLGGTFTPFQP